MALKTICILGMHRSGTSMLTRLLNICGVYIGERNELLGINLGNDKGHWENKEIVDINEEILKRFSGSWSDPPKFPAKWVNCPGISDLKERAIKEAEKMSQRSEIWGFKDPRTCLTLPFWKIVLPHMIFVIPVRDPFEVAFSLNARDGMTVEKGLFLWQYYWAQILEHTNNENKIFTFNENFFKNWKPEIEKIIHLIDEPRINISGKEDEIESFIDPDLCHQKNNEKEEFDPAGDNPLFYFLKQTTHITANTYQLMNNRNQEIDRLSKRMNEIAQDLDEKIKENEFIQSSKFWKIRTLYCKIKYESFASNALVFIRNYFNKAKCSPRIIESILNETKRHGGYNKSAQEALQLYRQGGIDAIRQAIQRISDRQQNIASHHKSPILFSPITTNAEELLELRILIVAELNLPLCTKYRVTQKQTMIKKLGIECSVISWTDSIACFNALSTHSLVIFYRVSGFDCVLELISEARRLKIPTIWEVDDLIFDRKCLEQCNSLAAIGKRAYNGMLDGAGLYLKAMLACDKGLASSGGLALEMESAGAGEVFVIENALDQETLDCAEKINAAKMVSTDGIVRIVYGSGTNTHNVDFEEAADAILQVLEQFDNVKFRLIGPLELSKKFKPYESKIEKIAFCDYKKYLSLLAECDISIAPLEKTIFNDAKSNIKFLEASIVKIPSVCSSRATFRHAITHGENGFLCETQNDFKDILEMLVKDSAIRKQIGESAYVSVIDNYSPDSITNRQVLPLVKKFKKKSSLQRILFVNAYYNPRSLDECSRLTEEVNKTLNNKEPIEIYIFTTLSADMVPVYKIRRYESDKGICIFGMGIPDRIDEKTQFKNSQALEAFESVLSAVQPDLVILHCVQGIGAYIQDLCEAKGIKHRQNPVND